MAQQETMKDPWTTARTDRHRANAPKVRRSEGGGFGNGEMNIEDYIAANPGLAEIAKAIALARLQMYNQDSWGNNMGWLEAFEDVPNPTPKLFTLADDGEVDISPEAQLLLEDDPEKYTKMFQDFGNWMDTGRQNKRLVLKPMTKEVAERDYPGYHWSRTTDEYMKALQDRGIAQEEGVRELAQHYLMRELIDDLASGEPKYADALKNRFLKDVEDPQPADTTEIRKRQGRVFGTDKEFKRPNAAALALGNGFVPFITRNAGDPELRYKTSVPEWAARGLADAGLWALYGVAPEKAAADIALRTGIGSKIAAGGLKNMLARAGTRFGAGGLSGASGWSYKQLLDPAYDAAFGVGVNRGPADLRDLGLETFLMGLMNMGNTQFLRGGKESDNAFRMREWMAKDPKNVSFDDIMDSWKVMSQKKLKDVKDNSMGIGADEITNIRGTTPKAKKEFASMPMDRYHELYPNEGVQFNRNPPLEVKMGNRGPYKQVARPVMNKPHKGFISAMQQEIKNPKSPYFGAVPGEGLGNKNTWLMSEDVVKTLPTGRTTTKKQYVRLYGDASDPQFFNRYMAQNPKRFANMSPEERNSIAELANEAQLRESGADKYFGNGQMALKGKDYAEEISSAEGHALPGDPASAKSAGKASTLKNNPKYVNIIGKKVTPAPKKQVEHGQRAVKKYAERKNMNLVSKSDLQKSNNFQQFGNNAFTRGAGAVGRLAVTPFLVNNSNLASHLIPTASEYYRKLFGPPAQQIEYKE